MDEPRDGLNVGVSTVSETWERLAASPTSVLVDVRTQAEWTFVGVPDLSAIGKQALFVEWQSLAGTHDEARFVEALGRQLAGAGADHDWDLFFICRSGSRSLAAAQTMASQGYRGCHNVVEGFEGTLDGAGHRGTSEGWKVAGLPWRQS